MFSRASAPLLLKPTNLWLLASRRVLIVGQETNGWCSSDGSINTLGDFKGRTDGVPVMQRAYEAFAFGENYRFRNSAFWRAFRILTEGSAGLWTNLFRADVSGPVLLNCSRSEQKLLLEQQEGLLQLEIQHLEPTALVFLTGPRYDSALARSLGEVRFRPLWRGVSEQSAALVYARTLEVPAIRLFHPTYLQRSRRWGMLIRAGEWLAFKHGCPNGSES